MKQEDTDRSMQAPDELPDQQQQGPVQIFIGNQPAQAQPQAQPAPAQNPAETALAAANIPAAQMPKAEAKPQPQAAPPSAQQPPQAKQPEQPVANLGSVPQMPKLEQVPAIQQAPVPQQPVPDSFVGPLPQPMTPEQYRQKQFQESLQEIKAMQADIQNQHITPKTYSQLTGSGVLDKIGTGFAILLGGMGSGLTHQPNAVLEMMNNEINRDLEAQKTNKGNKLNLLQLSIQHEMNKAQIDQLERQGQLTTAQATMARNEAAMRGYEMAMARYNMLALEKQRQVVEDLRRKNSPLLPQAEQTFGLMSQLVDNKIVNVLTQAAGRQTMMRFMFNQGPEGQGQDVDQQTRNRANYFRMMGDQKSAENIESKHFQGVAQDAARAIEKEDHKKLEAHNVLDDRLNDLIKFAIEHRGSIDPSVTRQGKQKAEEVINFYNQSLDKLGMTEGRLDWLKKQIEENPTNIFGQVLGSLAPLREIKQSNLARRDKLMQNYGIKEYPKQKEQTMPEMKTYQGHQYMKVPGGWQKVK